jgi:ribosome maturation protein Sdo1
MMAVAYLPTLSRMQIRVQTGTDSEGKPVFKSRNYNNLKPSSTDEDFYAVALAIAGLQTHLVDRIRRINEGDLNEA